MLKVVNISPVDTTRAIQIIQRVDGSCRSGDRSEGAMILAVFLKSRPSIEIAIVVPADHHLVRMGQRAQPVDSVLDFPHRTIIGEVAGVDEKISIRNIGPFEGVRVGNADDSDGLGIWWCETRRTSQTKEDLVERIDEGGERGSCQVIMNRAPVVGIRHSESVGDASEQEEVQGE